MPDKPRGNHMAFGRRQHRRVLVAAAVRLEDVGREPGPVLGEVPARRKTEAPGVLPLELDFLRLSWQMEIQRANGRPVRPGDRSAQVPGRSDVPVEAARNGLRQVERRLRRSGLLRRRRGERRRRCRAGR